MNYGFLTVGLTMLLVVVVSFSWLVAFGPLFQTMAYPGDLEPRILPTIEGHYAVIDCLHTRVFFKGRVYPMTDGVIARECEGA
jgi:hypothetical protein